MLHEFIIKCVTVSSRSLNVVTCFGIDLFFQLAILFIEFNILIYFTVSILINKVLWDFQEKYTLENK